MDIEILKFGFQVLEFILTGGLAFYVYMSNKDKVTNDRIEKLEEDIDEKIEIYGERIATLEERSENHPTHDDLGEIHEKINNIGKDIGNLSGEFKGVSNLLNTLHHYLLNGGNK